MPRKSKRLKNAQSLAAQTRAAQQAEMSRPAVTRHSAKIQAEIRRKWK